ncbi:uncharacterized protein M421DRAFT_416736 [Didymella exigua CBS 183.55]|uniref:Uncharacterized protein n=1 Tax=Didymella exigua CBS 183.55 TaxID=1150837 RepID=A0A6A5RYA5_9PLEO|nr:uncharacterized protein M421DRAFT_416736 [Didymella exigua CBS 183.55]KAF1932008.1 hypothetical protein M421DRAFT_416736 [Didymella exigua CBS 183.55]
MEVYSLITSSATIVLIAGLSFQYTLQWTESYNKAGEEMLTLIHEAQNTRSALNPIELYANAGYATDNEKELLLKILARVRSLNVKLHDEMSSQLQDKHLSTLSRLTWFLRRPRLRQIAANIATQKDTLLALQVSMLARKIEQYEPEDEMGGIQLPRRSMDGFLEDSGV